MSAVELNPASAALVTGAGFVAGFVNSIVGSGTLFSFPTLVGLGYAEQTANIANGTGLFPGSVSAVSAQRQELAGQRGRLIRLVPASAAGAVFGAIALLSLPSSYFGAIVPFLILLGVGLVIVGPTLQRRVRARTERLAAQNTNDADSSAGPGSTAESTAALRTTADIEPWAYVAVFLTGIYGGYFGAAQGIILIGILGVAINDTMRRLNATKNVLAATANGVSALVFIIKGGVVWWAAAYIALGAIAGGQVGARVGRRISPTLLRALIVIVGVVAAGRLLLK